MQGRGRTHRKMESCSGHPTRVRSGSQQPMPATSSRSGPRQIITPTWHGGRSGEIRRGHARAGEIMPRPRRGEARSGEIRRARASGDEVSPRRNEIGRDPIRAPTCSRLSETRSACERPGMTRETSAPSSSRSVACLLAGARGRRGWRGQRGALFGARRAAGAAARSEPRAISRPGHARWRAGPAPSQRAPDRRGGVAEEGRGRRLRPARRA